MSDQNGQGATARGEMVDLLIRRRGVCVGSGARGARAEIEQVAETLDEADPEWVAAERAAYRADAPPAPGEPRVTMDGRRDAAPGRTSGTSSGCDAQSSSEVRR